MRDYRAFKGHPIFATFISFTKVLLGLGLRKRPRHTSGLTLLLVFIHSGDAQ